MSVDFNSTTWKWVVAKIAEYEANQLAILTNPKSKYMALLRAQGAVQMLKTLKDLPQENRLLAATRG